MNLRIAFTLSLILYIGPGFRLHAEEFKQTTILPPQQTESVKSAASDTTDEELEKALAEELGVEKSSDREQSGDVSVETATARRGMLQNMNPNIGVIGSFLGSANSTKGLERNLDLAMQEAEFSFQAVVDPYARADFFVAFGHHHESELVPLTAQEAEGNHEEGLAAELEEAYVTFLTLPFSMQLKLGKFRSRFGKINETHPHAYNFIDLPVMYENYFGPDGLADEGASLSWLLPNKSFFQELTLQVTSGPGENASFTRAESNKLLYLAHLKNFFDLNDETTLEVGFSGLTGPNSLNGLTSQIFATDLTFKWRPLINRSKSFEMMAEGLFSKRTGKVMEVKSMGFYGFARYQLAKRWFLGGLFDYAEFPEFDAFNRKAYSGILQFLSTEFQKLELQYRFNQGNFFNNFSEIKLRGVFVIGAHGAHQY